MVIYHEDGRQEAPGQTDAQGVYKTSLPPRKDPYSAEYAVIGQPGDENFSLIVSSWNQGMTGWDFGIPVNLDNPHLSAYLYTDRPIYRPGQTVYFRAVVRQAYNGRYAMPDRANFPLIYGETPARSWQALTYPSRHLAPVMVNTPCLQMHARVITAFLTSKVVMPG